MERKKKSEYQSKIASDGLEWALDLDMFCDSISVSHSFTHLAVALSCRKPKL